MLLPTPPTILLAAGGLAMVSGRFLSGRFSMIWGGCFLVSLMLSAVSLWMDPIPSVANTVNIHAVWTNDSLAVSEQWLALLFGLLVGIAFFESPLDGADSSRTYGFLAFEVAGLMLVARANDFLSLGLAFEIVGLAVIAYQKCADSTSTLASPSMGTDSMGTDGGQNDHFMSRPWSELLLSGCLWLGIGLLSNAIVTTQFDAVGLVLVNHLHGEEGHSTIGAPSKLILLATGLIVLSLSGRMSLVPFHLGIGFCLQCRSRVCWGVSILSGQLAGSMALCRLCGRVFVGLGPHLIVLMTAVGLASFFLASVTLVRGLSPGIRSVPRWLTSLVLFQSAWLIVGVMTAAVELEQPEVRWGAFPQQHETLSLIVFSQFAVLLSFMGIVGILDHLTRTDRGIEFLEDLKGLGQIAPVAAVTLLVSLAGSIGCPWTAGFWSRWLIMLAANNVHLKSTASFFEPHGGIRFVILVGTIATIFMASMVIRIARETILESPLARTAPLRRRGPLIAGLMSAVTCLILGVVPDALLAPLRSIGTPREPRLEVPSKGSGKNRSVFRGRIRRLTDFEGSHCQARSARQVNDHFLISTKLACCTWQSSTRWAQFCPVWSGTSSPDYQPREDNPFILVDPNS